MSHLELIVGCGILSFLFLMFAWFLSSQKQQVKDDEGGFVEEIRYPWLTFVMIIFFIISLVFVAKAINDGKEECYNTITNTSESGIGANISILNNYGEVCYTSDEGTYTDIWVFMMWFLATFVPLMFLGFFMRVLKLLIEAIKLRR